MRNVAFAAAISAEIACVIGALCWSGAVEEAKGLTESANIAAVIFWMCLPFALLVWRNIRAEGNEGKRSAG